MRFLSGEQPPGQYTPYTGFPAFKDAVLLDEGLPDGTCARYIQAAPYNYPGDVPLDGDPEEAVHPAYLDYLGQLKRNGCRTERLLVLPGMQANAPQPEKDRVWQAKAFAEVQRAGEKIRIAWLGDVTPQLLEVAGISNPYLVDYFGGVTAGDVPRASVWDVLAPNSGKGEHIQHLAIAVLNYTEVHRPGTAREVAFEGLDAYAAPFTPELQAYTRAWNEVYEASQPLAG